MATPQIKSIDDMTHIYGDEFALFVDASDDDGDELSYNATGLPDGVFLDSETGLIKTGASGFASTGEYETVVTVDDGEGNEAEISFTLNIANNTYTQKPENIDPIFDETGWPEDAERLPYQSYTQRVYFLPNTAIGNAVAEDVSGVDNTILYGGGASWIGSTWQLITGFSVENLGGPDPIPDYWVVTPEYSNQELPEIGPSVKIINYTVNIDTKPSTVTATRSGDDGSQSRTLTRSAELTEDGRDVVINDDGWTEWTPDVTWGPSGYTTDYTYGGMIDLSGLCQSAIDNQRTDYQAGEFVASTGLVGKLGNTELENATLESGGLSRTGMTIVYEDYDIEARLPMTSWQNAWTLTMSTSIYEIDETLRDLDYVGTKDGGWSTVLLDFDITESTNLITIPDSDPAEQCFFLDLHSLKPTLTNDLLEGVRIGYREDTTPEEAGILYYPSEGIDNDIIVGIYPADSLDHNAIIQSPAYTSMV